MLPTPRVVFLWLLLALVGVQARIGSIIPISGTYHATSTSTYPLTFSTFVSPTTNEDFSAALGIQLTSGSFAPPALGVFFQNLDLVALGHAVTGNGNFTVNVKLPSSAFSQGSGNYTLTAAVTAAYGAVWSAQLEFYTTTFIVAV